MYVYPWCICCEGVAFAAGLAVGYWKDLAEVQNIWHSSNHWVPLMDTAKRDFMVSYVHMNTAVACAVVSIF